MAEPFFIWGVAAQSIRCAPTTLTFQTSSAPCSLSLSTGVKRTMPAQFTRPFKLPSFSAALTAASQLLVSVTSRCCSTTVAPAGASGSDLPFSFLSTAMLPASTA